MPKQRCGTALRAHWLFQSNQNVKLHWDDELDRMTHSADSASLMLDDRSERRLDPMNISDPPSVYFLLGEDVQDEISDASTERMECWVCGHRFLGEVYRRCPKCKFQSSPLERLRTSLQICPRIRL